jgi:hypothetical protein
MRLCDIGHGKPSQNLWAGHHGLRHGVKNARVIRNLRGAEALRSTPELRARDNPEKIYLTDSRDLESPPGLSLVRATSGLIQNSTTRGPQRADMAKPTQENPTLVSSMS